MKWNAILALGILVTFLSAGRCSREHVLSVEAQNSCVEFHQRQMFPQAIRDCSKAISLDPENGQAQHALALVYIETKEYEQAARHLQKAIAINSKDAMTHYQLGEVYEWLGQNEQAVTALKEAVQLDDTLFKAHYRLGRVAERQFDPQTALQKYTDALQRNPRFFEAFRELGSLYMDYGYLDNAAQVFDEGIKALAGRGVELAVLHHLKGTVFAERKEYEAAIAELKQALELNPSMDDAMFSLGWSYSYVNKESAKMWLEKFMRSGTQKTRNDYREAAQARLAEIQNGTPY